MLKRDSEIKWNAKAKRSFIDVNEDLTHAPIFISLDYTKVFIIFSFASEHTIAAVLLQKNKEGHENPIAFFSRGLRDAYMKYNIMEKKAFSLVKP